MSLPEIQKSVVTDYKGEVVSKLASIQHDFKARWIRNGRKDFKETIHFPVKSRNHWHITICCTKNGIFTTPYLISYNNIGVTASFISTFAVDITFMHFNTHFFKRFRERLKITVEKPEELVKLFFKQNLKFIPCYSQRSDGSAQLFIPLRGGVGLGNYHIQSDIWEFKTFVDYSLLGDNQKREIQNIWTETLKALTAEMKRRLKRKEEKSRMR